MDRRRALATFVSVTIGAVAIATAVGATTRVFNAAEASPGVGRVSPVTTGSPVVEHRIVDVEDPLPAAPPASAPVTAARPVHETVTHPPPSTTAATVTGAPAAAVGTTPTSASPRHEIEPIGGDD